MCLVYMDDVLIYGSDFDEHLSRLDCVLSSIGAAGLTLNITKCRFCVRKLRIWVMCCPGAVFVQTTGMRKRSQRCRTLGTCQKFTIS